MHSLLSVSLLRFLSSWLSQLQYSLLVCEQALISPTAQLAKLAGFRGGGWRERVRGWVREGSAIVSFAVYHWSVTWRCVTPQKLVMKKKQFNFHFTVRSHVNKRHRLYGIADIFFCTLLKASFKLAPYHFSKLILLMRAWARALKLVFFARKKIYNSQRGTELHFNGEILRDIRKTYVPN